jgi:hypothetical protein
MLSCALLRLRLLLLLLLLLLFLLSPLSLIGSWGPVLLPLPWQAFREWWLARCPEMALSGDATTTPAVAPDPAPPAAAAAAARARRAGMHGRYGHAGAGGAGVPGLVVNAFWRGNADIWTPWMVR